CALTVVVDIVGTAVKVLLKSAADNLGLPLSLTKPVAGEGASLSASGVTGEVPTEEEGVPLPPQDVVTAFVSALRQSVKTRAAPPSKDKGARQGVGLVVSTSDARADIQSAAVLADSLLAVHGSVLRLHTLLASVTMLLGDGQAGQAQYTAQIEGIAHPVADLKELCNSLRSNVPTLTRILVEGTCAKILNFDGLSNRVGDAKWDMKEPSSDSSDYVSGIVQAMSGFAGAVQECRPELRRSMWGSASAMLFGSLTGAIAQVRKVSVSGRTHMKLDLAGVEAALKALLPEGERARILDAGRLPGAVRCEAYITLYFLPTDMVVDFAGKHPEYSLKEMAAVAATGLAEGLKRKARQELERAIVLRREEYGID
ncbi:hypothetical protein KIPB_007941, partial [Kipferlia bialata]